MKRVSLRSAVLASFVLGACSGGNSIDWAGTVTDSAGVTIVHNPAEGVWNVNSGWDVEEELRIGTADGDPDYMFGSISGIAVTADGSIYVLDTQASLIRAFDQSGVLQLSFGSKGSGPGQIQLGAGPIIAGAGDTLYVPDVSNRRVNRYTTDGIMAGSFLLQLEQGLPFKWEATESGTIVNQVRRLAAPGQVPDTMDLVAERNAEGAAIDTLLRFRSGRTFSFSGGAPGMKMFAPEPMWTLASGGGVWHGVNDDYRIGLYEAGSLAKTITKPFEMIPVTERDIDVIKTAMKRLFQSMGLPPQALQFMEQGLSFGEYLPAYAQFLQGPIGSVWVQHMVRPGEMSEQQIAAFNPQLGMGSPNWDIFDSRGRFLGTLNMPDRFQPVRFVANNVYGVWRDDLDVQYVMKLRITGLPGADTGAIPIAD